MNKNRTGFFSLGISLAVGIALGGYFVGQTMYNAKVALNTAEAKGLVEKRVQADRANWKLVFKVAGSQRSDIPDLYKKMEQQQQIIINLLKENGFDDQEINIGVIKYFYEEFRDEDQKLVDQRHQLNGSISIETNQVKLVAKVRAGINKLIAQGIDLENHEPIYRFTKLNEIKPEMLKEAAKNARIAANEFAENAGVSVGGIRSARQGSFEILDAGETYGNTRRIEKDVRVVTTVTFYLTD
jgi:uncharacterized protein